MKEVTSFFSASQARFSHARFSMDLADLLLWSKLAVGNPHDNPTIGDNSHEIPMKIPMKIQILNDFDINP